MKRSMKPMMLLSVVLGMAAASNARADFNSEACGRLTENSGDFGDSLVTPLHSPGRLECWEDCIRINTRGLRVAREGNGFIITDGTSILYNFGTNSANAERALQVMQTYHMDEQCFVGRPGPHMEYLLMGAHLAPTGVLLGGEDCIAFDNNRVEVRYFGTPLNTWKIVQGDMWMLDFGMKSDDAQKAFTLIKKYGFNQQCFVGRPNPPFSYWKKS